MTISGAWRPLNCLLFLLPCDALGELNVEGEAGKSFAFCSPMLCVFFAG